MKKYNRLWRAFFAIGLVAIAIQQLVCADFRPVIVPPAYPEWLHGRFILTCIFSVAFIAACTAILFEVKARTASLLLAGILLLLVPTLQLPFQLFGPYPLQIGVYTDLFKELTLSGGAFIVAGSLTEESNSSALIKLLAKLIPAGKYFLAITMVVFGIEHFVYVDFVRTLVPGWIPGTLFWTYFAGVALSAAGIGILLNIQRRLAALLLGVMIFIWLIILHIPLAISDPHSGNGNQWTSVFEALIFSGIAFLLTAMTPKKSEG
ncbi:MAG: hypothetical protein ACXVA2_12180 [Mucilaginibacter sp.]